MVSAFSGLNSRPGWGHCVVFFDSTLYPQSAFPQQRVYKWVLANQCWWWLYNIDNHPIQLEWAEILLVTRVASGGMDHLWPFHYFLYISWHERKCLRVGLFLACVYRVIDSRGRFEENERSVRDRLEQLLRLLKCACPAIHEIFCLVEFLLPSSSWFAQAP